jgi:Xaa-Pro dipeptidase
MADTLAALYPAHLAELSRRHDRALREGGFDHAVIYAGAQHMIFLDDMPYPFKVNPHFKAWVPVLDNPNCMIAYTPGRKPRLVYYQPVDYWYKPASDPTGFWVDRFDIEMIAEPEEARKHLPSSGRIAFLGETPESVRDWPLGAVNPPVVIERLHYDRSWKTPYEIECMRQANVRGARGHRAAERAFREGASEYQIHLAYLAATSHAEEELPYPNIIAINENAAVLHYWVLQRDGGGRHSFLIDAGASVNGYASDITRTYSHSKDEFQSLIDAMDRSQQEICANVKPGVSYPDLHMLAHRLVSQMLAEFDFVRLDPDAILARGISSAFFPHGVGHYLGLQVHDVAGFHADATGRTIPKPKGHPYLRLTRTIEENQVFTIEPGLYFIDPLLAELRKSENAKDVNWARVDSFRKFGGIRVEDNIAVTAAGYENLTRNAFAQVGSPVPEA